MAIEDIRKLIAIYNKGVKTYKEMYDHILKQDTKIQLHFFN